MSLEPGEVNLINVKFNETPMQMPIVNLSERKELIKIGDRVGESVMTIQP